jgi:hypothetical protein
LIKFFGTPLKEITSKLTNKVVFRFDSKGEFITDDPEIIKRAMGHFDHMPVKIEESGDRVRKIIEAETMKISTNNENIDYSIMNFNDLRKLAKEKGIDIKNPTKDELIKELEGLE